LYLYIYIALLAVHTNQKRCQSEAGISAPKDIKHFPISDPQSYIQIYAFDLI